MALAAVTVPVISDKLKKLIVTNVPQADKADTENETLKLLQDIVAQIAIIKATLRVMPYFSRRKH